MDMLWAALGLVILVLAGDVLVRGAVNVSLRLGVPALIVSLTIVAIGTSAPELLISINAVRENAPGIAVGNVVGSNIANVLLVLGVPALLVGLGCPSSQSKGSYLQMLVGTALFVVFAVFAPLTWIHGMALLGMYLLFMGHAIYVARQARRPTIGISNSDQDLEGADPGAPWWRIGIYLLLGMIGLPLGADILVDSATNIARQYSISETTIGLTLVAVGTSLPELATSISAAFRKQADVALGNVIGSNMANLLGIIGVATFFGDIPVDQRLLSFDLWVMVAASVFLIPFVFFRMRISRIWGLVFSTLYVVYIVSVLQ